MAFLPFPPLSKHFSHPDFRPFFCPTPSPRLHKPPRTPAPARRPHHRHLPPASRPSFEAHTSDGRELYQPYRPPSNVVPGPSVENLSLDEQLEILRDRRGLWYEYAVYVASLSRAGFTPPAIDESTGMTGVEQNKITVASQVRSSLQSSGIDEESLAYFDLGGADVLYELRILSAEQRRAAAELVIEKRMDPKDSKDLARAIKDYERRRREEGWDAFSSSPGDCLAFACYRQSKESRNDYERESALNRGLAFVDSEKARAKLIKTLYKEKKAEDSGKEAFLQLIRLSSGDVAEARMPLILPVINPTVQEYEEASFVQMRNDGPFRIHRSKAAWKDWVILPGWEPLTSATAPIAIAYPNGSMLPWKPKSTREAQEPILVVVDKGSNEPQDNAFFLVRDEEERLSLQLGIVISETGGKALGKAILALRPPFPRSLEPEMEDWD